MADLPLLFERIRTLVAEPDTGVPPPRLEELEHTLTDGYARALALEGERWRIERQITELARTVDDPARTGEIRGLAVRLTAAETNLARLRELLRALRARADAARG